MASNGVRALDTARIATLLAEYRKRWGVDYAACGAPGYRDGWTCMKQPGHEGSHGVPTEDGFDWYDWPRS